MASPAYSAAVTCHSLTPQIMTEIRPVLKQYTVYPKFVDNPGIEQGVPQHVWKLVLFRFELL